MSTDAAGPDDQRDRDEEDELANQEDDEEEELRRKEKDDDEDDLHSDDLSPMADQPTEAPPSGSACPESWSYYLPDCG